MFTGRIRTELEKLRALQPDLTRDQALTFFRKFYPNELEGDVIACVDQMDLRVAATPRSQKINKPSKGTPSKSERNRKTAKSRAARTPVARHQSPRTATCPACGQSVELSDKDKLVRHKGKVRGHSCLGGGMRLPNWTPDDEGGVTQERTVPARKTEFTDNTGVAKGLLAPSDSQWISDEGWLIAIGRAQPSDIVTARRVLQAATNGQVPAKTADLVQRWYQDMKRRPELFDPRKKPRAWPDAAVGDPEKQLRAPTTPGKKVFYREVLVGKRN